LLKVLNEKGIDYHIVKTFDGLSNSGARDLERKIKRSGHTSRVCPVCSC
jgi:hypothetical protein